MSDVLERLRKASAEATPAPWKDSGVRVSAGERFSETDEPVCSLYTDEADAALIALARNHLDALLDVAEAARKVQEGRNLEQPKHFAEFVTLLDAEREALARLSERERE